MLTKLVIRNFKRLQAVEIELGQTVVFIGPNNSGKTTALQALALWYAGLDRWLEHHDHLSDPDYTEIATVNPIGRFALTAIPVPRLDLLWHDLKTKNGEPIDIVIKVEGVDRGVNWHQELSFRFANDESIICNDLKSNDPIFDYNPRIFFLTPLSGIAAVEPRVEIGRINVLIGEGRTAEVLRNLCYGVFENTRQWDQLQAQMRRLFSIELLSPEYIAARGEIRMAYRERNGYVFDISSAGRGMLQVLLLLSYLYLNSGAVILLDEADAHLEIIRQREVYHLLTETARERGSQIIMATHSEAIMNEAGDRDTLIAFVGKPHRIDDRSKSQVAKAIKEIGFDQYYQAEQTGWVLYLEGATDRAILLAFAEQLGHEAASYLARPYVDYVANNVVKARDRFFGLREAKPDLVGVALFDHLERSLQPDSALTEIMWRRREIENYLCQPATLIAYAEAESAQGDLMRRLIEDRVAPAALRNPADSFWINTKMSDDFLNSLFEAYFAELNLPNLLRKTDYHVLTRFVPINQIDPEVTEKLDAIVEVAKKAKPRTD